MQKIPVLPESLKKTLKNLPVNPGVYFFLDKNKKIIYIGKAKNLKKRVSSYFRISSQNSVKTEKLISKLMFLDLTITTNELEALLLEQHLIKKYLPVYNIQFKDDKGYPWIKIDASMEFPAATSHLGKRESNNNYYGPFPSSQAVRETLNLVQKTFGLRNCNDSFFKNRNRPCLQHQIGRCSAPCVGLINKKDYSTNVKEASQLFIGKGKGLIKYFYEEMDKSSLNRHYEKAANYRDKISALREIQRSQSISGFNKNTDAVVSIKKNQVTKIGITYVKGGWIVGHKNFTKMGEGLGDEGIGSFILRHYLLVEECPQRIVVEEKIKDRDILENYLSKKHQKLIKIIVRPGKKDKGLINIAKSNTMMSLTRVSKDKEDLSDVLNDLKESFNLSSSVMRLESYDISHFSGSNAVGACVVYGLEGKLKNNYRTYNISKENASNDIASMQEVIKRRFLKLNETKDGFPNLLIIDGGYVHLKAVRKTLDSLCMKSINLLAISKGVRRKANFDSIHSEGGTSYKVKKGSKVDLFLQEVRDETHRFAISSQKRRQQKSFLKSSLDTIPGIGSKKRTELLRFFGSYKQIERASASDFEAVPGISTKTANNIYNFIHQ